MRVLIASDSFKGSLSSMRVGEILVEEMASVLPKASARCLAVGDGGEGTLDAVLSSCGGKRRRVWVSGPLGRPTEAEFALLPGSRAFIEAASANGLTLVSPDALDPMAASSYGVGELVRAALDAGAREIILGVGGSATNEGGAGMLRALDVRFFDDKGEELLGRASDLARIHQLDVSGMDERLNSTTVRVMCDVNNPLCGPYGATYVFGPQKGLAHEELAPLDTAMGSYAACVARALGHDESLRSGAGAAGGLGFACKAFMGAQLSSGIECVLDLIGFDDALSYVDMCITGEGHLDEQTARGKVVAGVARRCLKAGVPCIAVVGGASTSALDMKLPGLRAVVPCVGEVCTTREALASAELNLRHAARRLFELMRLGGEIL